MNITRLPIIVGMIIAFFVAYVPQVHAQGRPPRGGIIGVNIPPNPIPPSSPR